MIAVTVSILCYAAYAVIAAILDAREQAETDRHNEALNARR